ncbi:Predicted alpha-1,6-mannanase, GH76 family [Pseudarthrobacter enclensis]|uniref:Glycosyl hydrolase n=1 Tax=Pseudarthrobacter enclensis TaxID=993070 RepID=A0A0V8IH74_9MICC|nr:glycoside hydrolase family 76 protein [Pseudarthrobacter enclensis]KSU73905.1 glycosyl hydrolase [Pseudarthrobacter enclensis]SCC19591.1 Predicted alpha-1,6-mannanase, GH76 family [Pseudarthrobacter enclensis]
MTSSDAATWHQRANDAARSVTALFGRRLLFLPNTHLASVTWGGTGSVRGRRRTLRAAADAAAVLNPWHYWWQAHYLDCLVDTGLRELGGGATPAARFNGPGNPSAGRLGSRLVTGIRIRNLFTMVNNYYDDMAWLALATDRLDRLAGETRKPGRGRNARVRRSLTLQFDAAGSDDLGGGVFWSKKRDFKNTPANAPVALHYARTGRAARAQALVDWLDTTLFDPEQHLYLDGARAGTAGEVLVERTIYTYNQGPILGALLELGGDANLARAAALVAAVDRLLTVPAASGEQRSGEQGRVLRCEGSGDGGLFTGILCRYLALAARDSRLPGQTRKEAARLVLDTAQAFWDGRRNVMPGESSRTPAEAVIFSAHASAPAEATFPAGAVVELSTQLQAWMAIEAAATVAAS